MSAAASQTSKIVVLSLLVFLVATATVAGEGEFGIELGVIYPDEQLSLDNASIEPSIGLRGGYRFTAQWGWIVDAWFSEMEVVDVDAARPVREDAQTIDVRTAFEVMFGTERKKVRWFGNLGAGLVSWDVSSDTINRSLVSFAFGQRFEYADQKYIRWEARADQTISDDGFGGENVSLVMLNAVLTWGIGGKLIDDDGDGVADRRDDCLNTPRGAVVDSRGCAIDSDGDGVPDGIDQCPGTAAGWPVDATGCPLDTDGDGVPDGIDACPGTPSGAVVDRSGCPMDSDGDGVPDGIDQCPDTPLGAVVDATGCPIDTDGDGVPDGIDQCPDTPLGAVVDEVGCPVDSDGDGVPDGIDQCPDTPAGVAVDEVGCPLVLELPPIHFEFNSSDVNAEHKAELDQIAQALLDRPDVRVEVAGNTDSTGIESYNHWLSVSRAMAVYDYLVEKGIPTNRMVARGYGTEKPAASDDTAEGRAKNRRVDFSQID